MPSRSHSATPLPAGNVARTLDLKGGTAGRFTATAVTALNTAAQAKVDASLQTDLVLDVVGYYR